MSTGQSSEIVKGYPYQESQVTLDNEYLPNHHFHHHLWLHPVLKAWVACTMSFPTTSGNQNVAMESPHQEVAPRRSLPWMVSKGPRDRPGSAGSAAARSWMIHDSIPKETCQLGDFHDIFEGHQENTYLYSTTCCSHPKTKIIIIESENQSPKSKNNKNKLTRLNPGSGCSLLHILSQK